MVYVINGIMDESKDPQPYFTVLDESKLTKGQGSQKHFLYHELPLIRSLLRLIQFVIFDTQLLLKFVLNFIHFLHELKPLVRCFFCLSQLSIQSSHLSLQLCHFSILL